MSHHTPSILAETSQGRLFRCAGCDMLHLEFGMLLWRFPQETFLNFYEFMVALDLDFWEHANATSPHQRKVLIDIPETNITLAFSRPEIEGLRDLLQRGRARIETSAAENVADLPTLFEEIEQWLNAG